MAYTYFIMKIPFIDLKSQYQVLKPEIDQAIQKVLDHGQYILGPEVTECEKALAQFVGCKHALAVASGTDAAVIALMALGVGPGDEVIVPAFSFIATAEAVVLVGATPVFIDVEKDTYNLDATKLEALINKNTKAIMPVSLYGQTPDMDAINAIANKHKLPVIEDAAQSFGGTYKGKKSCNLSTIGVTSFFPAKPLGCYGDGGAIFTNDAALNDKMSKIRVHGQSARYYHDMIGVNGRLDTLQCAILMPKLKKFPWELEQRDRLAKQYNEAFKDLTTKGVVLPQVKAERFSAWAQYTIEVPERDKFQKRMEEAGVPTSVHYPRTMADQPAYTHFRDPNQDLSVSEHAALHVVSLPMHPYMEADHFQHIVKSVKSALG